MQFGPFLLLRVIHILAAASWLGAAAMLTLCVLPAVRRSGAAGGTFIAEAVRCGLPKFMAIAAGLTVLSGFSLYWHWSTLVGASATQSTGGILLMAGAVAGIAAGIIGGAILAPSTKQLAALADEDSVDAGRAARIAALHLRMTFATRLALSLLVIALVLMVMSRFG